MSTNKNIILKDILWYLIGNLIPLLIGLIKSPIYTRFFSPADYGAYSLVFISFNYISIICYSWIISCAWRYYHQYKENNKLNVLFSSLTFLYILFSCIILVLSSVWFGVSANPLIKKLILLCFFQFFTSEISSLFFIRYRLEGKVLHYNLIQSVRALGSFGLLVLFTFIFDMGIEAFLTSNIILNVVIIAFVVIPNYIKMKLSFKFVSKQELLIFFKYGQIGIIINICSALLISSDRFIIEYFTGLAEVGIYNQNYNIAQTSIVILINVYWTALNPYLLPILEFRPPDIRQRLYEFFKVYVLCFLPLLICLILYAKYIADIMLGENFRVGYEVIALVAISEFLVGLYFINLTNFKFKNKIKVISFAYIIALLINVVLNFIFIPKYDYRIAAFTTVISHVFLLLFFYGKDKDTKFYRKLLYSKDFKLLFAIITLHCILHIASSHFSFSILYYISEGLIFCILYIVFIVKYTNTLSLIKKHNEIK